MSFMLPGVAPHRNGPAPWFRESGHVFRIQLDLDEENCDGWIVETFFTRDARIEIRIGGKPEK